LLDGKNFDGLKRSNGREWEFGKAGQKNVPHSFSEAISFTCNCPRCNKFVAHPELRKTMQIPASTDIRVQIFIFMVLSCVWVYLSVCLHKFSQNSYQRSNEYQTTSQRI